MSGSAMELRVWKRFMHPFAMERVEGMQVEHRLHPGTAIGQFEDVGMDGIGEGITVEKHKIAVGESNQRALRSHVEKAPDPKTAANGPETP